MKTFFSKSQTAGAASAVTLTLLTLPSFLSSSLCLASPAGDSPHDAWWTPMNNHESGTPMLLLGSNHDGARKQTFRSEHHGSDPRHLQGSAGSLSEGIKTFLFLRMVFDDGEIPAESIQKGIFETTPNFMDQLNEMSFGKLQYQPADVEGSGGGILDFVVDGNAAGAKLDDLRPDIVAGLSATGVYDAVDYFFVIMPKGTINDEGDEAWSVHWRAEGAVHHKIDFFNENLGDGNPLVDHFGLDHFSIVHNIGHDLNAGHAFDNKGEHEDESGLMGPDTFTDDVPDLRKGFNGAYSYQMGWYNDQAIEMSSDESYSGKLCGVVDYDIDGNSSPDAVLIKIDIADGEIVVVAFNRATGFNADTKGSRNKVTVTRKTTLVPFDTVSFQAAVIGKGQSETILAGYSANGVKVDVRDIEDVSSPDQKACAYVDISPVAGNSIPSTCADWTDTSEGQLLPDLGMSVTYYFDLEVFEDSWVTSLDLGIMLTSEQLVSISIIEGSTYGVGTLTPRLLQSVNVTGLGNGQFTALPPFDEEVHLKAGSKYVFQVIALNGLFSDRKPFPDTRTSHRNSDRACPNCPFEVFRGISIVVSQAGPAQYTTPFHGKINYCAQPTKILSLKDHGSTPAGRHLPLQRCEGDCDGNHHCDVGLTCYQRGRGDVVPGCQGNLNSRSDYCVASGSILPLKDYGGRPDSKHMPLQRCEGDCDDNGDCDGDMECYQRGKNDEVPGCEGRLTSRTDYCVPKGTANNRSRRGGAGGRNLRHSFRSD